MSAKAKFEKCMEKGSLSHAIRVAVLAEYEALCSQFDLGDKMLERHLLRAILPAAAFYRALPKHGHTKEAALAAIRSSLAESAKPMAKLFHAAGWLPFFFPHLRVICPASMKSDFGESGWDICWKENSREKIAFEAHSCFYERVLANLGMPELVPLFCEVDDITYGNIPSVRWGRTKTIGQGGDCCDFCFFSERRNSENQAK
jgi:hypothetical protein